MSRQDIQRLRDPSLACIDLQTAELENRCHGSEWRKAISAVTIVVLSATAAVSGTIQPRACSCANISSLAVGQKSDGVFGVTRSPLPAPVGHRQPRSNEVPPEDQASIERERWLDKGLDRKLHICNGC